MRGKTSGRSRMYTPVIDMDFELAQRQAFLAELAMQPEPSIGKRVKCKLGQHGNTARKIKVLWKNRSNEGSHEVPSLFVNYFCVSCGQTWREERKGSRKYE
jgi:hypothetical protein